MVPTCTGVSDRPSGTEPCVLARIRAPIPALTARRDDAPTFLSHGR